MASKIALLQVNPVVGDISGNALAICELSKLASIEEIPTYHYNSDFDDKNYDELISLIRLNLENNQIQNAWNIVLYLEKKHD